MTTADPAHVRVHSTNGVVQVEGLSQSQVEFALELAQDVQDEQLRARAALSAHVQQAMLSHDIPLVPRASQRQIQRNAEVRRRLLEQEGAETYASLAELRGTSESSIRTWVARKRKRKELFTVELQGRTLIPSVLLTDKGRIDPVIAEISRPLLGVGLDGWPLWSWLTSPDGLLSGEVPARVAQTNMSRAHRASERFATTLRESAAGASEDARHLPATAADDASTR